MTDAVDLRCPSCNRFLAEVAGEGRAVCAKCGWEIIVRDKNARRAEPVTLRTQMQV